MAGKGSAEGRTSGRGREVWREELLQYLPTRKFEKLLEESRRLEERSDLYAASAE